MLLLFLQSCCCSCPCQSLILTTRMKYPSRQELSFSLDIRWRVFLIGSVWNASEIMSHDLCKDGEFHSAAPMAMVDAAGRLGTKMTNPLDTASCNNRARSLRASSGSVLRRNFLFGSGSEDEDTDCSGCANLHIHRGQFQNVRASIQEVLPRKSPPFFFEFCYQLPSVKWQSVFEWPGRCRAEALHCCAPRCEQTPAHGQTKLLQEEHWKRIVKALQRVERTYQGEDAPRRAGRGIVANRQ